MPDESKWSLPVLLGLKGAETRSKRQWIVTIVSCGALGILAVLVADRLF
jgi:threonine dehydrogenase-like Zn-dependent dehydrogenase